MAFTKLRREASSQNSSPKSEIMEEVIRLTERNDKHFLVRVGRDYLTVPQFKKKVGLKI